MASDDVKGIDIIIKKKPSGTTTIQLVDNGNGLGVTNIMGAQAADYESLRQIGGLVGALLTGNLTSASIHVWPNGTPNIQMMSAIHGSKSNIKNN